MEELKRNLEERILSLFKGVGETILSLSTETDKIIARLSLLEQQIQSIFAEDRKLLQKEDEGLTFQSLSELTEFILSSAPGHYKPVIKGLNVFDLYRGDEETYLYYPKFIQLDIPSAETYEGMVVSKFLHNLNSWE